MKTRKVLGITIITISVCIILAIVDGIIAPNYWIKSLIKLILFIDVPLILLLITKDDTLKKMFKINKKRLFLALGFGLLVYGVIILGYFLLRNTVDFSNITKQLVSGEGITKNNFIFVALYISVINSFCEEFLFRGFAFMVLNKYVSKGVCYIFSSLLFALYHIAIMTGWFNILFFILIIVLLGIAGAFLNRFDDDVDSIYPSWLIHLFANLGINTIGLILFGII